MHSNGKKVLVAMSGGVDSSVVAALLMREGYEVVGCFMRLGSDDSLEAADGYDNMAPSEACHPPEASNASEARNPAATGRGDVALPQAAGAGKKHKQGCCSVNDAGDARHVAAILGVPFYVMNFKKDFGRIIDYFVDEYNAGRTPNPCVRCNDWLKFGKLHGYARSIDCDYVASGHYARIERDAGGRASLRRGVDRGKDQSYVLFGSPRDRLDQMLLPLGEMEKSEVRRLADEFGLPVFDKPDSQEICFVPDNDYARLVERRTPGNFQKGAILDVGGRRLGEHAGHQHFTLGQRRGIGVAVGRPVYVVDKDPQANTVTVGDKADLLAEGCTATQTNWLVDPAAVPTEWLGCGVKVRYNSPPTPGRVRATGADRLEVRFDEPVSAVTPGQAVVCYVEDRVVGGGWIDTVDKAAGPVPGGGGSDDG
ncbi:MAG: tRNA 2-thiouridine(34) synthase MnmA [Planctomycetota bacterium]